MKRLILAAILALGFSTTVVANELDNESSVTNKQLTGTIVVRVDNRTKKVAALKTSELISEKEAQEIALSGDFKDASANVKSELDQDGGASSWYFYYGYNSNYYCNMNYYGNWYRPTYYYNYSYYSYYYYGNYWW